MKSYLVIGSVTKALRAVEVLYKKEIQSVMTKPTKEAPSVSGCVYSAMVDTKDEKRALEELRKSNVQVKAILRE